MELRKLALGGCVALAVTGCFFDFADPTVDPRDGHAQRSRRARPIRHS